MKCRSSSFTSFCPSNAGNDMLYSLFEVIDVVHGIFAMTIKTIQCQLVKTQSGKFSTRPILSFTAESIYF